MITPQGAGKTVQADVLAAMFQCTSVVDEWDGVSPVPDGALVLTNCVPTRAQVAGSEGVVR